MIVIVFFAIGVGVGVAHVNRRKGNLLDKLQYGSVFGIIAGILGLFATLILERMF